MGVAALVVVLATSVSVDVIAISLVTVVSGVSVVIASTINREKIKKD